MRFLTKDECQKWFDGHGFKLNGDGVPLLPSVEQHHVHLAIPSDFTKLTWFCGLLSSALTPRRECLLWATGWGIWEENLHLYYRLRQSYGDLRLIHEAPGCLFLDYENSDLVSFLEVMIICGWDVHLMPTRGFTRAFVSHDEFVEFASDDNNPNLVSDFEVALTGKKP